jgi:hypothetical protein
VNRLARLSVVLLFLIPLAACQKEKSAVPSKKVSDQNYIAIREEFRAGNFDNTLSLIRQSGDLVETNLRDDVFRIKVDALKAVVQKLNRQAPKTNASSWQKAQLAKYRNEDIRLVNGRFCTMGRDYEEFLGTRKTPDPALMLEYLRLNASSGTGRLSPELARDFQRKADQAEKFLRNDAIPAAARSEIILFLRDAYLKLSGLAQGMTNVEKRYFPDLHRLADLVVSGVKDKGEVLSALFLKMYLYGEEGSQAKARQVAERIGKEFPAEKLSAVPLYWKANEAYLKDEARKALGLYQKALAKASGISSEDLRRNFLDFTEDADHFRQDIVKRMNVIKSEIDYQKSLATRKFAVVTGDNVRLRQTMDAATSENVITSLGTGEKVIFIRRSAGRETVDAYTDYWYYVRLRSGNEGWIFGKYLLVF